MSVSSDTESGKFNRRKLAGFGYILADSALFAHGLIDYVNGRNRDAAKGRMFTGLGWGIGGISLAKYGNRAVSEQLDRLEHKLAAYLQKEGVPLDPDQLRQAEEEKRRGWFKKIEDFVYNHPTDVLNAYYGLAATGLIYSGLKTYTQQQGSLNNFSGDLFRNLIPKKGAPDGIGEFVSGFLVVAGALVGIFLKEKSPQELKNAGFMQKLLHTQPLAWSSGIYMANNYGAYLASKTELEESRVTGRDHHRYSLRFVTLAAYVLSNLLVGSGSKKAGGKPEEREQAQEALAYAAGRILAAQSPAQQQFLASKTAEYLVKQRELRLEDRDPAELAQQIMAAIPSEKARAEGDGKFQRRLAEHAVSPDGFSRN